MGDGLSTLTVCFLIPTDTGTEDASFRGGNGKAAPPPPPLSSKPPPPPPPASFQQPLSFLAGLAQRGVASLRSLWDGALASFRGGPGGRGSSAGGRCRGSGPTELGNTQQLLFSQHILLLILWLVYLQPLQAWISHHAYRYFTVVALLTHAFKVCSQAKLPRLGCRTWWNRLL